MAKDDQGRELSKHTLYLFQGDYARLGELFPSATPAKIIRHLVRNVIDGTRGERPVIEVDLED